MHSNNALSVCVLGSSSSGNATVIWNAESAILIDCGFGPPYLTWRMEKLGLSIADLDGVLITHVHGDHVNDLTVWRLAKDHVPIYCPAQIHPHLQRKFGALRQNSHLESLTSIKKPEIEVSGFLVRPFEVPHDSAGGCFGYSVLCDRGGKTKKVSITTDMARPTKSVVDHMADSDAIVMESNYDVDMLEKSARPAWLKRRIREDGHLSNDQCAESLLRIIDRSQNLPTSVALAHISQECNTNALALDCTQSALKGQGIRGIGVFETHPDRPGKTITV